MTDEPVAQANDPRTPRRTPGGADPTHQPSKAPAPPRPRPTCCAHPERHTSRDRNGWWRHTLPGHVAGMLADARSRAGLSWSKTAKATGLSVWFLRQLVQGVRAPGIDTVDQLADGLQLTSDERELLHEYAVHDTGSAGPWGGR